MSDDKIMCPSCESPDTINYWAKTQGDNLLKFAYPHARRCVDCDFVWNGEQRKRIDLDTLRKGALVGVASSPDKRGAVYLEVTGTIAHSFPQNRDGHQIGVVEYLPTVPFGPLTEQQEQRRIEMLAMLNEGQRALYRCHGIREVTQHPQGAGDGSSETLRR